MSATIEAFRLWGITTQIDLCNALVGLGGIALAWATWRSTSASNKAVNSNQKKQGDQRIAEFRMNWCENLRSDVAQYAKLHRSVELSRRNTSSGKLARADRPLLLEISEVRARVQMLLKTDSQHDFERNLLDLISTDVSEDEEQAKQQRLSIISTCRSVLKTEWQKIKNEINQLDS